MNPLLKTLVAAACVTLTVTGGLWLRDRSQAIAAAEAAKAIQAETMRRAVDARARERVAACAADLAARDAGNILAFVTRANGGDMMAEVEKCRTIVARGY